MDNIRFLLKFGEREHLEGLANHTLYFNNALYFRGVEKNMKIKGQGDKLEASMKLLSAKATMVDDNGRTVFKNVTADFHILIQPVEKTPVFCLFAVFDKDCICNEHGKWFIHLPSHAKETIREHFPKANAVAIIKDPSAFITEIAGSIGTNCMSDLVHYFDIDDGVLNEATNMRYVSADYIKYLVQDVEPVKVEGRREYSVEVKHVFRTLFCKDTFYKDEQEYRIILPDHTIEQGTPYSAHFSEKLEILDLEDFFNHC